MAPGVRQTAPRFVPAQLDLVGLRFVSLHTTNNDCYPHLLFSIVVSNALSESTLHNNQLQAVVVKERVPSPKSQPPLLVSSKKK